MVHRNVETEVQNNAVSLALFYSCENVSRNLREGHKYGILENRALRRILEKK
jgi:hypothetical protein